MTRVLVVDDSEYLAHQISAFLEEHGFDVCAIGRDGFEGFTLYKEHHPDIVTLDLTMPNRDGRECLEDIVKYDSDAKVIVISALSDKSIVVQCLEFGARDFIQKPLKFKNEEFCKEFLETFNDLMV
jgi:two-component system chemotaxis response regulator CheY